MVPFLDTVLGPLFDELRPRRVGWLAGPGGTPLAPEVVAWGRSRGIEIAPVAHRAEASSGASAPDRAAAESEPDSEAHELGIDPGSGYDVVFVATDANWFAVRAALRAIDSAHRSIRATLPLIAVENTGWPWGRRDRYDAPEHVPAEALLPSRRAGVVPDRPDLVRDGGLHADRRNAIYENTLRNGVRTAIEDFTREREDADAEDRLRLIFLPGFGGLGLLATEDRAASCAASWRRLGEIAGADAAAWLERLDRDRALEAVRADDAERRLADIRDSLERELECLAADLDTAARNRDEERAALRAAKAAARVETRRSTRARRHAAKWRSIARSLRDARTEEDFAAKERIADLVTACARLHRKDERREEELEAARDALAASESRMAHLEESLERAACSIGPSPDPSGEVRDLRARLEAARRRVRELELGRATGAPGAAASRAAATRETVFDADATDRLLRMQRELSEVDTRFRRLGDAVRRILHSRRWRLGHAIGQLVRFLLRRAPNRLPHEDAIEILAEHERERASRESRSALVARDSDGADLAHDPRSSGSSPDGDGAHGDPDRSARRMARSTTAVPGFPAGEDAIGPDAAIVAAFERSRAEDRATILVYSDGDLERLRATIGSLRRHTDCRTHRVLVIDDSGVEAHGERLRALCRGVENLHVTRHETPLGRVAAIRAAVADLGAGPVCLLGCGVVVTPGWLEALVRASRHIETAGVVSPVTASTSYTALEPAPGDTPAAIARKVELLSPRQYPTTALPDLDALFLRRDLLEAKAFAIEGDTWSVAAARWLLAVQADGYRCVIADDTYVHVPPPHDVVPVLAHLDADETRLFESLENGADGPEVEVINAYQDSDVTLVPGRCAALLVDGCDATFVERAWIRLANDLILRGVDVRVVASPGSAWPSHPDRLFRPVEEDLDVLRSLPADAHVFACSRRTAALLAELREDRPDLSLLDFLVDFERDSEDGIEPSSVDDTPGTPGIGVLTTTEWARREIRHHLSDPEVPVRKIPLGIPLETFWAAPERQRDTRAVLARTHGGASDAVLAAALARIREAAPDVEIRLIGDAKDAAFEDLPVRHLGDLDEHERREALHDCDVYVSARPSRGLDLGGLEAMACGRAAVLANGGGTAEYARHDHNALLFDPGDPEDLAARTLELIEDGSARSRLAERALSTIANYGRDRIAGELEYVVNAKHARRAAATRRRSEDVTCNIVIPIYNELGYVRMCLESIVRHTDYPYRVFLVDDGSDSHTKAYLRAFCERNDRFRLIENEENLGFVASCNRGMAAAPSGDILLLNSDVIVTPDWLRKIVTCAYSDDRIGIVSPMSTRSSHLWIRMNPGDTIFTTAAKIEECSDANYPDIVTPEGWCFFIRRDCYDHLGGLDPVFGKGYCEESDYSMRALANGYRTVCADDTFVFHKGRVTFKGERGPRYKANRQIFDRRWKPLYRKLYRPFLDADPLGRLRERYAAAGHPEWIGREPALEAQKKTLKQRLSKHKGVLRILDRKDLPEVLDAYRASAVEKIERDASDPVPQRVTFVLSTLERYGGVISVVQLANDLVLHGIDARIVVLNPKRFADDLLLLTEPIFFRDSEAMATHFPPACNVVATLWITLYHIAAVMREQPDLVPHYFVQDYEPLFVDESDPELRERVVDTYRLPSRRFAKTRWIIDQVARHEADVAKVPPGLDLDVFYPRDVEPDASGTFKILVMMRPKTTRRGFSTMLRVFPRLLERHPEVEIHAFGTSDEDLARHRIPFRFVNHGPLEPHELAYRYSASDVYADLSSFQGFGRTGLEAMACGTPCLLTDSGGVAEYAVDDENCVLVDPRDDDAILAGFERLIRSEELRRRFAQAGLATVPRFEKTYSSLKTWEFLSKGQYRAPEPNRLQGSSRLTLPPAAPGSPPRAGLTAEHPRKP